MAGAAVVAMVVLGGCGGGGGKATSATDVTRASTTTTPEGCGVGVEEVLDPQSGRHLLPGAPEPAYISDPPTSGPHPSGGTPPTGVVAAPIPRPLQVQLLEGGGAVVQYRDLRPADVETLRTLASVTVAVAPGPADLSSPIVITTWVHKLLCEAPDTGTISHFITQYAPPAPPSPNHQGAP